MKKYYIHNDWEGKYYWTYDRKKAVAAANKMIKNWMDEMFKKGYCQFFYDGDFRKSFFSAKSVQTWDYKHQFNITIEEMPDLRGVEKANIIEL